MLLCCYQSQVAHMLVETDPKKKFGAGASDGRISGNRRILLPKARVIFQFR